MDQIWVQKQTHTIARSVDLPRSSLVNHAPIDGQAGRYSVVWKLLPHSHIVFVILEYPHSCMLILVLPPPVWRPFRLLHVSQSSSAPAGWCSVALIFLLITSWVISSCDYHIFIYVAVGVSSNGCVAEKKLSHDFRLLGAAISPCLGCILFS